MNRRSVVCRQSSSTMSADPVAIARDLIRCRSVTPADGGALQLIRSRAMRSEEHTSELQSPCNLVCRLLLEKKKIRNIVSFHRSYEFNSDLFSPTLSVSLPLIRTALHLSRSHTTTTPSSCGLSYLGHHVRCS